MTKEELQKELDKFTKDILAKFDAREIVWPKVGDQVFVLFTDGQVCSEPWTYPNSCEGMMKQGNIFSTRALAERERDRRALLVEIEPFRKGFVPDWDNVREFKYWMFFDNAEKAWSTNYSILGDFIPLCGLFRTDGDAQAVINHFGDRLNLLRSV